MEGQWIIALIDKLHNTLSILKWYLERYLIAYFTK
ncbi:hypothetical protein CLV91_1114 [Maribacter vaceletii]|uniref:Uncharacterized protein n=1 Tax=Maribacter vaceletii TaxID=1206816 RepID=A0A495EDT4_9FLAO|nr:hypothetical protein CLV91_1114 [Maribacter vaceletii]